MDKFEVAQLSLKENDLLVFKYIGEDMPQPDEVECLVESLRTILPKGIKVLITGGELEIYVASKEETDV